MENIGYFNEFEIVDALNKKQYSQLNGFMKYCVSFMYPSILDSDIIYAEKYLPHAKADLKIEVNGEEKYISVKSSRSSYVHAEGIPTFIEYLKDMDISQRTIDTILFFQYGDGTLNGTGQIRCSHEEIMEKMKNEIYKANYEMSEPKFVKKTIERFMFTGGHDETHPVDFVLFGDPNFGVIASKEEIITYALRKRIYTIRTLHIGPIIIRPYLRDINFVSRYQEKRNVIQGDWHNLLQDILTISEHR